MSVHPGARDVLTWAVERYSATVSEANAATEVVMPLDTLRMLADQLKTVMLMTPLEKVWKLGGVYTNAGIL